MTRRASSLAARSLAGKTKYSSAKTWRENGEKKKAGERTDFFSAPFLPSFQNRAPVHEETKNRLK